MHRRKINSNDFFNQWQDSKERTAKETLRSASNERHIEKSDKS